jgi:hypothetical protein
MVHRDPGARAFSHKHIIAIPDFTEKLWYRIPEPSALQMSVTTSLKLTGQVKDKEDRPKSEQTIREGAGSG